MFDAESTGKLFAFVFNRWSEGVDPQQSLPGLMEDSDAEGKSIAGT